MAIANCSDAQATVHGRISAFQHDVREAIFLNKIIVNTDTSVRYIYPNKCQIEGEIDLFDVALHSEFEESYVFVPELCVWIETGYAETERTVQFDRVFFDRIVEQYDALYIYHVHPGIHLDMDAYFPAYQDFIAMTLINSSFVDNPNIQIKHKIVTRIAIMDYKFIDIDEVKMRLNKYNQLGLRRFSAQNLSYEYMKKLYVNEYLDSINNCSKVVNNNSDLVDLCNPISTSLFLINIESFRSFFSVSQSTDYRGRLASPSQ